MKKTKGKTCYICGGNRFVDDHHYDCQYGKLSPETVPLCRRCHRTYHDWGIESFSPDTTEKALEVENKRREILRSLPPNHPQYHRAELLGILSPLKLGDVKRSRYWYKKWGITPPTRPKPEKSYNWIPFKIPNNPICGDEWLSAHLTDHTTEEIEALAIEIGCDNRWRPPVSVSDKRGTVKAIIDSERR